MPLLGATKSADQILRHVSCMCLFHMSKAIAYPHLDLSQGTSTPLVQNYTHCPFYKLLSPPYSSVGECCHFVPVVQVTSIIASSIDGLPYIQLDVLWSPPLEFISQICLSLSSRLSQAFIITCPTMAIAIYNYSLFFFFITVYSSFWNSNETTPFLKFLLIKVKTP